MANNTIKPITLEINQDLWLKFKDLIPRRVTLNEAIVMLIAREVNKAIKKDSPLFMG